MGDPDSGWQPHDRRFRLLEPLTVFGEAMDEDGAISVLDAGVLPPAGRYLATVCLPQSRPRQAPVVVPPNGEGRFIGGHRVLRTDSGGARWRAADAVAVTFHAIDTDHGAATR